MRLYERFADKGYHTSIATTFGIDFDAYENIVLPRIRGAGCHNNVVLADRRMLTHALGGASALPGQAGRLYTAAGAPSNGLFHPKLFMQIGRKGGRLIIGSANMTASGLAGNLELVAMFECQIAGSGEQQLIAQAWQYLSGLIDPKDPMLPVQREWLLNRAAWLRTAVPATGPVTLADGTEAALLIADGQSGIGSHFAAYIDEPVKRLTVISPYWDKKLAALSFLDEQLAPSEIAVLIDPETELFPRDVAANIRNLKLYRRNGFETGRFIHAKALIAETDNADHLLIGSANCTAAALGTGTTAGSNDEASMYRRLPPGTAIEALGLSKLLQDDKRVEPDELKPLSLEDDIPLDTLATQHPGIFSLRGDTLIWLPSANISAPEEHIIDLLNAKGRDLEIVASKLKGANSSSIRYQIEATEDVPAFAKVQGSQAFAPAIITHINALQSAIRETHSKGTETTLAQLEGETEASLSLLEALDVLEQIEDIDTPPVGEGVSIPKAHQQDDDGQGENFQTLSYDEFVAGRRPNQSGSIVHNSFGGSDVSIVRGFLNRIVGLNVLVTASDEDDGDALKSAFDLGDETDDAAADLESGIEFEVQPKAQIAEAVDDGEVRRKAKQRKATKDQIVSAASNFSKRIDLKLEKGELSTRDFLRLRALLMIICAASWKGRENGKAKQTGRTSLQVLPVEGDPNNWPVIIGRLLFKVFSGSNPAIRRLKLETDHDQLPADLIECWATCFWCLQACFAAPLSTLERVRIDRYITPLAKDAYQRTFLSKDELMAEPIISIMDGMSNQYTERLKLDPRAIAKKHQFFAENGS